MKELSLNSTNSHEEEGNPGKSVLIGPNDVDLKFWKLNLMAIHPIHFKELYVAEGNKILVYGFDNSTKYFNLTKPRQRIDVRNAGVSCFKVCIY